MQRIRQGAAATLEVVFTDQLGTPGDVAGPVTVTVRKANGTAILTDAATTHTASTGIYAVGLTATQTAALDELTATWTDTATSVAWTTRARIVGGFMFTIPQARAYDAVLNDSVKYPSADIAAKRVEVEEEAEWICDRAFVPTYARLHLDGDGTSVLQLGKHDVRTIRAVTTYDNLNGTGTTFTADELAALALLPNAIRRTDGGVFQWGTGNIVVDLEYGLDEPDSQMAAAAIIRLRSRLNLTNTQLPDRARSYTSPDGTSYDLNGADEFTTGIDAVDSVYGRFSKRNRSGRNSGTGDDKPLPASRTLSFDPQYDALFRGGPR